MSYLIAKIALLLAGAAIAGALFGRWLLRRKHEDVTASFELLQQELALETEREARMAARFDRLEDGLIASSKQVASSNESVTLAVNAIQHSQRSTLADLSPQIEALHAALAEQSERLAHLETAVADVQTHTWSAGEALRDLEPSLSRKMSAIADASAGSAAVDLSSIQAQLETIEVKVSEQVVSEAEAAHAEVAEPWLRSFVNRQRPTVQRASSAMRRAGAWSGEQLATVRRAFTRKAQPQEEQ